MCLRLVNSLITFQNQLDLQLGMDPAFEEDSLEEVLDQTDAVISPIGPKKTESSRIDVERIIPLDIDIDKIEHFLANSELVTLGDPQRANGG